MCIGPTDDSSRTRELMAGRERGLPLSRRGR